MADQEKIKRILRRSTRPGKLLTEEQIAKASQRVTSLNSIDEAKIQAIGKEVAQDERAFQLNAVDMSDINGELKK